MPKREDIKRILLLGSGPIVIGQACEFDYSGTQACKALREEGYEVILVNSNPATIMTDPESAHRVYIEPLEVPYLEKIIAKERPQALIPTLGGQSALNAALRLNAAGVLKKYGVELLGASVEAINKAEDRELFKNIMREIGAKVPKSFTVRTLDEGLRLVQELGYPCILRPSFTMGGSGGGIAATEAEFVAILSHGLRESPTSEVLIEESALGWKEFELEVMRDQKGTFVVVCSIENFDPMGVHTGDSITVAPALTLTDRQYQEMRDEAKKVIEAIGVATGGANIQFAVNPENGDRIVIEMNPRVSRSSALASKATGFPIAKIAAKLAVGYELHELLNDITKSTPSCFEPSIDYVVTKIPRFNFEKFPGAKDTLTTQMKSVGEVMGIGRTFKESLHKALASMEQGGEKGTGGLDEVNLGVEVVFDAAGRLNADARSNHQDRTDNNPTFNEKKLIEPHSQRIFYVAQALREGYSVDKIARLTKITPWFIEQLRQIISFEKNLQSKILSNVDEMRAAKKIGLTDKRIARLINVAPDDVRRARLKLGVRPGYWSVDTCAGEFESNTPYYYSTYHTLPSKPLKLSSAVVVLGSGPNRIGQAIEFDYGCVQGIKAIRAKNRVAVMINSNPETVSTDYDTSDYLFFEPLTAEHVLEVLDFVQPFGVCVQLGGQTPIHLAPAIQAGGHTIVGSSLSTIEAAEDRDKFSSICQNMGLKLPKHRIATNADQALKAAVEVGFPVIARPSFVLGGRKMEVLDNEAEMQSYLDRLGDLMTPTSPLLIDAFLGDALECDVDLVSDGKSVLIGGIVEHIEGAGIHSGDSMGVLPPQRLSATILDEIERLSRRLALTLEVVGHLNLQLAIQGDLVFILEANPRSSRSVPFVSKATGIPLVRVAMNCMLGESLHVTHYWRTTKTISVKGVVFPFKKFSEVDTVLGPEMRSTGESMGRSAEDGEGLPQYAEALSKAFIGAGVVIPRQGTVFISIRDKDKSVCLELARELAQAGFSLIATGGTAQFLKDQGLVVKPVNKVRQGSPHCVDLIKTGGVQLVINTTSGSKSIADSFSIRRSCVERNVPCLTELSAAAAFVSVLKAQAVSGQLPVRVSPL